MSEDQQPCALYRHFDEFGVLLYVGISAHPERRTGGHIDSSAWVRYADRGSVEWLPNLSRALIAERRAIQAERPIYNKQGAEGGSEGRIERYLRLRARYYEGEPRPSTPESAADLPPVLPAAIGREDLVTLKEAIERGILSGSAASVLRAAGRAGFPGPVGRVRTAHAYRIEDLREWEMEKLRRAVS